MNGPIPKKSLGQHWLEDDDSLDAMVEAAQVQAGDVVLEIGPGLGTLTRKLVTAVGDAGRVLAVEFDERLARELPGRVPAANLRVVQQDILGFDLSQLPAGYRVVANIPYYLTSNLVRVLSESSNPPSQVALLVQKEVAERIAAPAGSMSLLSVTAQYYWQVSLGRMVPAELFTPPPKVDSQIVILAGRSQPLFTEDGVETGADDTSAVEPRRLFRLVKAGFGERRKTLRNSLSGGLRIDKLQAEALLAAAGLDPQLRAQNLGLQQWRALYTACVTAGVL